MRKTFRTLLVVAFMLTLVPAAAFADGEPQKAPPVAPEVVETLTEAPTGDLKQSFKLVVKPSSAKVVVRPAKVTVTPTIVVKPASVLVKAPDINLPEMRPTFAPNIIVRPAPVVIQSDPIYKKWWFWTAVGVVTTGIVVGGVCGGGYCGSGTTTVGFN